MTTELRLTTDDGEELEAERTGPDGADLALVLAHPHPMYGGDMHAPVLTALLSGANGAGFGALRFNFRGAGRSTGQHDGGDAERLDVRAAAAAVRETWPAARLALVGYSFGADLVRSAAVDDVTAMVLIAPPLHFGGADVPTVPTLLLVPEHDQFSSPERASELTAGWPDATVETIAGTDHFLMGAAIRIADRTIEWLGGRLGL